MLLHGEIDAIYSTELEESVHITRNSQDQFVYEYSTVTSVIADDNSSVLAVLSKNSPDAKYYILDANQSRKDIHIMSEVETTTKTFRNDNTVTVEHQYRYHFEYDNEAARVISSLIMKNRGYVRMSSEPKHYKYEQLFVKYCEQTVPCQKEITYH